MRKLLILSVILGALSSCDKGEIPIEKPVIDAEVVQVETGNDYANQLFYSIYSNEVVLVNNREKWDLGFESSETGSHIFLNSSKMMSAAVTEIEDIEDVHNDNGLSYHYDASDGNLDSTAFGPWWNNNNVYVVDKGSSTTGTALGKMKVKIVSVDTEKFIFKWGELGVSTTIFTDTIYKNPLLNMNTFSFTSGLEVTIEPASEDWQLLFTQYTHVFEGHQPYSVNGVLINTKKIEVIETSTSFGQIDYAFALAQSYTNKRDELGYDWKIYDFDAMIYTIEANKHYILRDLESRYFKLRFVDFYTIQGAKGAPKFEIKELL